MLWIYRFRSASRQSYFRNELSQPIAWNDVETLRFVHMAVTIETYFVREAGHCNYPHNCITSTHRSASSTKSKVYAAHASTTTHKVYTPSCMCWNDWYSHQAGNGIDLDVFCTNYKIFSDRTFWRGRYRNWWTHMGINAASVRATRFYRPSKSAHVMNITHVRMSIFKFTKCSQTWNQTDAKQRQVTLTFIVSEKGFDLWQTWDFLQSSWLLHWWWQLR